MSAQVYLGHLAVEEGVNHDAIHIVRDIASKYAKSDDHMWIVDWEDESNHVIQLYPMFYATATLRLTNDFVHDVIDGALEEVIRRHMERHFRS